MQDGGSQKVKPIIAIAKAKAKAKANAKARLDEALRNEDKGTHGAHGAPGTNEKHDQMLQTSPPCKKSIQTPVLTGMY